jgi:predicted metal-dependent peptidase
LHLSLKKAINHLIFQEPFIGSLLPRLKIVCKDNDPEIDTMATDGKTIWWNNDFVEAIDRYEVRGVVAHEIFHCILLHMFRRGTREPKKWNYACDYALNPLVEQLANCPLPKGALLDTARFPLGMTAEQIYDLLDDREIPKDFICDLREPSDLTKLAEEIDWKGAVAVAAKNAKSAGKLSKELEQMLEIYLNPKIPWQQLLYSWMVKTADWVTNWTKSNRHYRSRGIYLPGKKKIPSGYFVLVYDVSLSMADEAIRESLTECAYIINEMNPVYVILIEHDVKITQVRKFERMDELPTEIQIHGRGGTDFNPVFDYVNDLDELPDCVVFFTDGGGPHPEYHPEYPVLWVMIDTPRDMEMNFGEQIWLD